MKQESILWGNYRVMNYTVEQKLDAGLRFLYQNPLFKYHTEYSLDSLTNVLFDVDAILDSMNFEPTVYNNGFPELDTSIVLSEVIKKLAKDGYLDNRGGNHYSTNIEGRYFISNGGYVQKTIDDNVERRNQIRNNNLLIIGSWMAGIGALALVLIEIVKKLNWVLSINALTAWFLFSLGICTGMLILLIIDRVLQQRSR